MAKRKEMMGNKEYKAGKESNCCCVNPNACDCNRGGVDLVLQKQLQDLHEQTEADIPISFSA